jgi:hypothetical protein
MRRDRRALQRAANLATPDTLVPVTRSDRRGRSIGVDGLDSDAFGQVLEPGRVGDCYLGLLLPPPLAGEPEAGRVLVVGPAALLHPHVPQPAGSLVYELLTGHPERQPTSWCSSPI